MHGSRTTRYHARSSWCQQGRPGLAYFSDVHGAQLLGTLWEDSGKAIEHVSWEACKPVVRLAAGTGLPGDCRGASGGCSSTIVAD